MAVSAPGSNERAKRTVIVLTDCLEPEEDGLFGMGSEGSFLLGLGSLIAGGSGGRLLLASVVLRRQTNGGAWATVRQVSYGYYDGTEPYGNAGDLNFSPTEVLAIERADRLLNFPRIHQLHVCKTWRCTADLISYQSKAGNAIASGLDPKPKILIPAIDRNVREQKSWSDWCLIHALLPPCAKP